MLHDFMMTHFNDSCCVYDAFLMLPPREGASEPESEEFLLLQNTIEPHNYLIYDNCNRDRAVNKEKLK